MGEFTPRNTSLVYGEDMVLSGLLLIVLCVAGGGLALVIGATILAIYFINKDAPRDH